MCPSPPIWESGFARNTRDLGKTVQMIIEAGAVGMNLEDTIHGAQRELYDLPVAVERVRAARDAANSVSVPLVINARTDVFLLGLVRSPAATNMRSDAPTPTAKRAPILSSSPACATPKRSRRWCAE